MMEASQAVLCNGAVLPLISPWIPFVLFCVVLGVLMILLSIMAVRRSER